MAQVNNTTISLLILIDGLIEEYTNIIKKILNKITEKIANINEIFLDDQFNENEIIPDIFEECENLNTFSSISSKIEKNIIFNQTINLKKKDFFLLKNKIKREKKHEIFTIVEKLISKFQRNLIIRRENEYLEVNTGESLESYIQSESYKIDISNIQYIDFNIYTAGFSKYEKIEFFTQILKGADQLEISQMTPYSTIIIKKSENYNYP